MVKIGGQKLVEKPSMARVDHDHLETAQLRQFRRLPVGIHHLRHLLLAQGSDGDAVGPGAVAGAVLDHLLLGVLVQQVSARILSGVGELHAGHRSVAADGVGGIGEAGDRTGVGAGEVVHKGRIRLGVHHKLADGDSRRAASGAHLIEVGGAHPDVAVRRDICAGHRRGENPVAEGYIADGNGFAQVGVHLLHFVNPSSLQYRETGAPVSLYPRDLTCHTVDLLKRTSWSTCQFPHPAPRIRRGRCSRAGPERRWG